LAIKLTKLLDNYALKRKIIVSIKDERSNLNNMITTLKSIVSYDMLGLENSFQGTSFKHAFPRLANMLQQRKIIIIYVNQIDSRRFAKMHNLAKFFWKG
jgi:hypothetical protein